MITNVPACDEKDVAIAVEAAKNAFYDWSNLTAGERRDHLRALANRSREHAEEIAKTISSEMGKPYKDALTEIDVRQSALKPGQELSPHWISEM